MFEETVKYSTNIEVLLENTGLTSVNHHRTSTLCNR